MGFRRAFGCIWVGFSELWSREFLRKGVLGSVLVQVVSGGGFRVVWAVEWGAEVLEFWVDLGEEMGVVLLGVGALVWVK